MFASRARTVPDIASACRELLATLTSTRFSTFSTFTCGVSFWVSVPSGPLMEISPGASVTSTLSGSTTGKFPILDMASVPLRHDAQHFATDAQPARLAVRHHALGRRNDGYAESVHHTGHFAGAPVDAQPRPAHALDFLYHRFSSVILQADFEQRLALVLAHREILDIAFVFQHLRDRGFHPACGHRHRLLFRALRIADAREHVGDRIAHRHLPIPPTSSP